MMNMTIDEATALFDKLDDNKNGLIEFNEFVAAAMSQELLLSSDALKTAFNMLDFNGDGHI